MNVRSVIVCLVENHKLVRRLLVLWACLLISGVTYVVFSDVSRVTGPVAAAYGAAVGILSVVLGVYQWSRHRDPPYRELP